MSNLSGPLPPTSGLALPNVLRKPPGELWTLARRAPGSSCAFLTNRTMLKTAADLQTRSLCWSPSCRPSFLRGVNSPSWHQDSQRPSRRRAVVPSKMSTSCSSPLQPGVLPSEESCDKHRYTFEYPCECVSGSPAVQGDRARYARQYGEEHNERGRRAVERIAEF